MRGNRRPNQKPMKSVLIVEKIDTMLRTTIQTQRENPRMRRLLKRRNKLAGSEIK